MIRAACTIVSANYLPYARTLCDSYLAFHPDDKFYVLLADRLPANFDISHEKFELVLVEDLGIPDFRSVAFKYDILELNTNVKPTFLKSLLSRGVDKLIYFDPDILICSAVELVFEILETSAIVVTPHCLSPNEEWPGEEANLLFTGAFNLGFIALSRTEETERFLQWWEHRCLTLGYAERWTGLFVDQKWISLLHCYFDSIHVLKHAGCNIAYWNLHERTLQKAASSWTVNRTVPLIFYHFSGISVNGGSRISKYSNQFDLDSRPELAELFAEYRERVGRNGIQDFSSYPYAFGRFSNGDLVNKLQRAAYAANLDRFPSLDPFDARGPFYAWANKNHLQSSEDTVGQFNRQNFNRDDNRIRLLRRLLRLGLLLLGANRYTMLMKYLGYVSVLRNQRDVLGRMSPPQALKK